MKTIRAIPIGWIIECKLNPDDEWYPMRTTVSVDHATAINKYDKTHCWIDELSGGLARCSSLYVEAD